MKRLVETYRALPDDQAPSLASKERIDARTRAQRELLAAVPARSRAWARFVIWAGDYYLPLRNRSRQSTIQTIDAARATARKIGRLLAAEGTLDDPEDVFFLTIGELGAANVGEWKALVAERRAQRAEYEMLELPNEWVGNPLPLVGETYGDDDTPLTGVAASAGVVEGRARVIHHPWLDDDIEPGEILVCATTDPSWTSYFFLAAGVVIDVGGPMSHGAVSAREIGMPCVTNTRVGTKRINTGDLIRVDGFTGTVQLLERAPTS